MLLFDVAVGSVLAAVLLWIYVLAADTAPVLEDV